MSRDTRECVLSCGINEERSRWLPSQFSQVREHIDRRGGLCSRRPNQTDSSVVKAEATDAHRHILRLSEAIESMCFSSENVLIAAKLHFLPHERSFAGRTAG
jgi:hypothetical protein